MEGDKLPYISVIIPDYNRKEFLLNAIKSVVNQTLDKKSYEIIVIKNFEDEVIDNYISENNIKGMLSSETSLRGKLIEALNVAKGNVISFLDDDDLFFENKLEVVYKEFKKKDSLVYYHNRHVPINKDGKLMAVKSMYSLHFNMSCISIKKSIVKIPNLDKIRIALDTLMYLFALESNKKIKKGKEALTYYMFHESTSIIVTENYEEFKKLRITSSNSYIDGIRPVINFFQSKKTINFINASITDAQIRLYILSDKEEFPSKLLSYLIHMEDDLKYRVKQFLACIVIKTRPKSRNFFSERIWTNYSNRTKEMNK